jgi:hypothetical protein
MNILPSLNVFPVPGHEEYTIIMMSCFDREARTPEGVVLQLWERTFYIKENITSVTLADSPAIIAKLLNTVSEQLEADDYETYPLVTKDTAYGRPYVM